jgi:hypothetical protein
MRIFKNMKKHLAQFKILILAIVIGLGANYALATVWSGPTVSAPGNNKPTILNKTIGFQSKGGPVIPGSLLNINGILSGQDVLVWNSASVVDNVTINTLPINKNLCVDVNHKLVACGVIPPVPGMIYVRITTPTSSDTSGGPLTWCPLNNQQVGPVTPVQEYALIEFFSDPSGTIPLDVVGKNLLIKFYYQSSGTSQYGGGGGTDYYGDFSPSSGVNYLATKFSFSASWDTSVTVNNGYCFVDSFTEITNILNGTSLPVPYTLIP